MLGLIIGDMAGVEAQISRDEVNDKRMLLHAHSWSFSAVLAMACANWLVFSGEKGIICSERLALMAKERVTAHHGVKYSKALKETFFAERKTLTPSAKNLPEVCIGLTPIGAFLTSSEEIKELTHSASQAFSVHVETAKFSRASSLLVSLLMHCERKEMALSRFFEAFEVNINQKPFDRLKREAGNPEAPEDIFLRALAAFTETYSFEDAIRRGVQLNVGNSNVSALTGAFAEAFYKNISYDSITKALMKLPVNEQRTIKQYYAVIANRSQVLSARIHNIFDEL